MMLEGTLTAISGTNINKALPRYTLSSNDPNCAGCSVYSTADICKVSVDPVKQSAIQVHGGA